jgi:hypothetical protein
MKAAKHNSNLSKTVKMALLSPKMSSDQAEKRFFFHKIKENEAFWGFFKLGPHLAHTWPSLGPHLAHTCPTLGPHLAQTCPTLGQPLTITSSKTQLKSFKNC